MGPQISPGWGWMLRHPARIVALGAGSGLLRPAPGTWGTLLGWVTWLMLLQNRPLWLQAAVIAAAFALGTLACNATGKHLRQPDHPAMVIDEIVAFWLILWLVPATLGAQVCAFVVFRLFDIFKPQPIRYFDRRLKNGFGVMLDDALAAFYTLLVFALWARLHA
jgi:phosphatidylglycerophosphatase A